MKNLVKTLAAVLALGSVPAHAASILISFNIVSGGGNAIYTASGGSFSIAQLVDGSNTINLPAADYLTLAFSTAAAPGGPSLTITNNATTSYFTAANGFAQNVAAGATLYHSAADFSLTGTDRTGSGGTLLLTAADNTQVALNSAFWADISSALNFPAGVLDEVTLSGGISGRHILNDSILSDTIGLTAAEVAPASDAPEPASIVLFTIGLGAGVAFRKRLAQLF